MGKDPTALARKDREGSRKASGGHGKVSGGHGKAFLKDHSIGKEGSGRQQESVRRAWQSIGRAWESIWERSQHWQGRIRKTAGKRQEGMGKYLGKITALARKDREDSRKASGGHGKRSGIHQESIEKSLRRYQQNLVILNILSKIHESYFWVLTI